MNGIDRLDSAGRKLTQNRSLKQSETAAWYDSGVGMVRLTEKTVSDACGRRLCMDEILTRQNPIHNVDLPTRVTINSTFWVPVWIGRSDEISASCLILAFQIDVIQKQVQKKKRKMATARIKQDE